MSLIVNGKTIIDDNKILQNINHFRFDGGSLNIGAPHTLNFNNSHYKLSGGGAISFTNNPPANTIASMIVILVGSGYTWPGGGVMKWNEGLEPPQSSSNQSVFEINAYTFNDGSTRYYGSLIAYNAS